MASLVLNGNTSGSITISSPAVSGTNIITLPAATGTSVLTNVTGNVDINAAGSNYVTLSTNTTERMRIDSSGNVGIGTTSPSSYGKLAVNGSIAPMGAIGTYSIDVTLGSGTTVSSGGTVNFSNASGMLVVNQYNTGAVTIYLCGGGSTTAVASVTGTVGSFAYNAGIGGYTWTSSTTTIYGFFFLRTRPGA